MFAHARPGHGRHLGDPARTRSQPRHHERDHQLRRSARPCRASRSSSGARPRAVPRARTPTTAGASPGETGKCWEREATTGRDACHHILKGGEDSIGAPEAIQRVYFNIGSCSEQCWVNHLTDLRAGRSGSSATSARRRSTSASAGATARASAPSRTACPTCSCLLPARRRPTRPLARRAASTIRATWRRSSTRSSATAPCDRGREVFAQNCARCHSSQPEPFDRPRLPRDNDRRARTAVDWLGNDRPRRSPRSAPSAAARCTPTTWRATSGTSMRSDDATQERRGRPDVAELSERRPRLLPQHLAAQRLGLRALHAQQRDRARGLRQAGGSAPELLSLALCRKTADGTAAAGRQAACLLALRPERRGRYRLYKASMQELLNPDKRLPKVTCSTTTSIVEHRAALVRRSQGQEPEDLHRPPRSPPA